ncbi:MAG TPA: DUF839 domain-containing protein [Panacibacter sp.]|nr:DUF839 domain-containing protein [Panacibacter sp.]
MKARLRKRLMSFSMQMLALCGAVQSHAQTTATGPSTLQTPFVQPLLPGYKFTSILSANDSIGGYPMAGTPDGLGAFDNGDGTFTLLMNHEFVNTVGAVRAHGSKGAYVSKWIINKSNLSVLSGSDLMQNVNLWNGSGYTTFNSSSPMIAGFSRFCSADLPAASAFYNSTSGLGTQERIFMNGEESGTEGRALAHIATGPNAGTTYDLPYLGKFAWENSVASPATGDKTVVAGMDDGTGGQVYFYVGTKTNSGTEIEKAGLSGGKLFGIAVTGFTIERVNTTTLNPLPAAGTRFSMVDFGDVSNVTGAALNTNSVNAGVTSFSRPEDGAWDPAHPNDFYFATTDQIDQVNDGIGTQVGRSRLWRLRFDDVTNPALGGTIEAVLDGTEGQNMMDNLAIDKYGHITLLEDVGNSAHNGKVWQYDIATDALKMIGKHDVARFGDINIAATAPYNQDEESSGVIDVQDILGAGMYLIVDQAHSATGIPTDLVENGQLFAIYNPDTYRSYVTAQGAGPSTLQSPFLKPVDPKVKFTSILSANDSIGGYPMAGTPDGLGAFDNGDGTFTLLMNHEFVNTVGAVRAHGSKGAYVSKWIINKSNLSVLSGSDLMQNVNLWNGSGYTTFNSSSPMTAGFSRFCSADLAPVAAYYNSTSGLGTQERIFMNGEESGTEGRALAHIATGPNAGTSYELPALGKMAFENSVASPATGNKTVVGQMDDGTGGQVYFYVGTKTNSGTEIEKAGLTNGKLYGIAVTGFAIERVNTTTLNPLPAPGTRFTLADLGDVTNITGATLNTNSVNAGVTSFSRPEDGAWDPAHPNDFYFNTTDQIDQVNDGIGTQVGRSRLWRLRFDDVTDPALGGTIEAVLDGTEGQNMMDNLAIDKYGHITLLEDVGNSAHNGKVWQYDIATDALKMIGKHDVARFGDINIAATAPYNQDEESSGVIDVQDILGAGMYLIVDQAHSATGIPTDLVENGQLLAMYNCVATFSSDTVTACLNYRWNGQLYNASGIYTYNTTNAAGCDSTATLVLTVYPVAKPKKPVIVADGNTSDLCPSETVTLSTVQSYPTYKWSTGATTPSIVVNTTGRYDVTITSADNGCVRTSDNIIVSYIKKCGKPFAIGATDISTSSATVSWTEVNCAVGYILQYRKLEDPVYTTVNISSGSTTSYSITGLSALTRYEWSVATICDDSPLTTSVFSSPKVFRTASNAIAAAIVSSSVKATGGFKVSVSPNPATTNANITVSGAKGSVAVSVSDLSGKTLWKSGNTFSSMIAMPVERLAKGIYIITVISGADQVTVKLVVAK